MNSRFWKQVSSRKLKPNKSVTFLPSEVEPIHERRSSTGRIYSDESPPPITERRSRSRSMGDVDDDDDRQRQHAEAAATISRTLIEMNTDDEELNHQILCASLNLGGELESIEERVNESILKSVRSVSSADLTRLPYRESFSVRTPPFGLEELEEGEKKVRTRYWGLMYVVGVVIGLIVAGIGFLMLGEVVVGPPRQPVGPYTLIEAQEGANFFESYTFYEGSDSAGSNGYLNYVSKATAFTEGLADILKEPTYTDIFGSNTTPRKMQEEEFVYMGSQPTKEGPRNSIRLEGNQRFNRGLFILDVRHMPSGCGTWPAFWLTDEPNWPVNGEIDILEGVNYQTLAKTALHTTRTCVMDDVPEGVKTGEWDTAIGVPDAKTGVPDMTMRFAKDCFVYNPHQWLNQGCVLVHDEEGTIGEPLNEKGGGVYVLEWDPAFRHIRSWVFTPHGEVPENLAEALRTLHDGEEERVSPDPDSWGLPYAYFSVGDSTDCPSYHFKNMRLVFNLAFCGSVSGNRYFMDCPKEFAKHKTCNEYIKSNPEALKEAYWKIKGLYLYEREWKNAWL